MWEHRTQLIQLMRAISKIDDQYVRVRQKLGFKESLFVLLYMCADGEERTQVEICEEWFIPRSTLNTTVKEQEAAGHIELVPRGKKQKLLRLTESGRAYVEELLGPLLDAEERAASLIDDELIEGIERFSRQLGREFDELGSNAS